jgi:hypothetical protein
MKLILSALLLFSINAFAQQEVYDWPRIGGIEVNQFCQTETTVQTKSAVKTCKAYKKVPNYVCLRQDNCMPVSSNYVPTPHDKVEYVNACTQYANEVVAYAKTYTAYECEPCYPQGDSSECVLQKPVCGNVTKHIATTYYVSTYMDGSDNSEGGRSYFGGNKKFTMPNCQ